MSELEMIQNDFRGLVEGVDKGIEKEILVKQANAIFKNYIDFVKTTLSLI